MNTPERGNQPSTQDSTASFRHTPSSNPTDSRGSTALSQAPPSGLCDQCGKSYPNPKYIKRHKQLCHPVVVYACNQPECSYSSGRKDVIILHLATTHDFYLPGDRNARSVGRAHLARKSIEALRSAYIRDSNELNYLRVQFANWELIRCRFEHIYDRIPRLSEITDPPAVSDLPTIQRWTKHKLIDELINVRMVLFGPNFGEPGAWNAFEEVAAVTQHVEALRDAASQEQQSNEDGAGQAHAEFDSREYHEMAQQEADEQTMFQFLGAVTHRQLASGRFVGLLGALRNQRAAEDREIELLEEMVDEA